ncbi:DUF4145 domain-containing protein [Legionella sp. 29fVS95]|uniref:DUF4145 domain-containing protein n=1 Tax=Legionella sp. 29fVS95 TaxID=3402813 RepID=UPI003AF52367
METLNESQGSIIASCPGCGSRNSTFEWKSEGKEFGAIENKFEDSYRNRWTMSYRLFKCAGCNRGALGVVRFSGEKYPGNSCSLINFYPITYESLALPRNTPDGIKSEFREAEKCLGFGCYRAAAGLFRSVLDKILRDNGYKKGNINLKAQIDEAAQDGVITESRKKRAHEEIRVLGNDILHEEWKEISKEDVELTKHYCQRILEDFYDDRPSVEAILLKANRIVSNKK